MIELIYPDNFTSPLTFQNSNFSFPHTGILALKPNDLVPKFYSIAYILPSYIEYINNANTTNTNNNTNINNNINIISILKSHIDFTTLGISFMKLKGLEEQLVDQHLFERAEDWLLNPTRTIKPDMVRYINDNYKSLFLPAVSYTLTLVQLLIINVISQTMIDIDYPQFLIDNTLITMLNKFNQLTMMDLDISIINYLSRIIPLILNIQDELLLRYQII